MTLDLSNDYLIFDNLENVTLVSVVASDGTEATKNVAGALRGSMSRRDLFNLGPLGVAPDDLIFNLPVKNMGGVVPVVGDTIRDAQNVEYKVITAQLATLQTRWSLTCRRVA